MKFTSFFRTIATAAAMLALPLSAIAVPTALPANIAVDNTANPNTITLTFSAAITNNAAASSPSSYTVTNNGGTITYSLAGASRTASTEVVLTLAAPDPTNTRTYVTNADITLGIKVTVGTGITDLVGGAASAAVAVTASGATNTVDATAPTLSSTMSAATNTSLVLTFDSMLARTAATTAANYTLSGTGGLTGNPSAAALDSTGTIVTLTVATMASLADGATVVITASSSVTDLAGMAVTLPSNAATLTVDRSPSTLTFPSVLNSPVSSTVNSAAATLSGMNVPGAVSVATGSDSSLKCATLVANAAVWSSFAACSTVTVASGDQLMLQLTSSSASSASVAGTISIGSTSTSFTVSTGAPVILPASAGITAVTALSTIVSSPDSHLSISSNGVIVVPSTVATPLVISYTATNNSAFSILTSTVATFTVGGKNQIFTPVGGDALAVLKSFTIDGYSGLQALEVSNGRTTVSGSIGVAPIAALQVGTTTSTAKQIAIMSSGTVAPVVDITRNIDGTGAIAVTAGKVNLRLASSASTVLLADATTTLYAHEVASIDATGKLTKIKVGSPDGTSGVVGDPLATSAFPSNFSNLVPIPKLDAVLERTDSVKILMKSLFDFIGPRANMGLTSQGQNGLITLNIDGQSNYLWPIGEVLVNTALADGGVLTDAGKFTLTRSGVTATMIPAAADTTSLATSLVITGGSILLNANGALEVDVGGKSLMVQPALVRMAAATGETNGFGYDASGTLRHIAGGLKQVFYPRFYDMAQVATTFKSLDSAMTLRDNMNGTVTATIKGVAYTLLPQYPVLSAIGGVPAEHRNDPWWSTSDGLIYLKYSNGSAQGFSVR